MLFSKIVSMFEHGNVCVVGERGSGKDVLFGNVVNRRKKEYISNLDYTQNDLFNRFEYGKIDLSGNTYEGIIRGNVYPYVFPYPDCTDIYISDAGCYFPAQYCNDLNKKYPSFPLYMALSRQISKNNVHINVQQLNRAWDKIREQSFRYILCEWCFCLFGVVIQSVIIYDKYESCVSRVKPCRVRVPFSLNAQARMQAETYLDNFYNVHGDVKRHILVYLNKSKHDTYYFKKFFAEGGIIK